MESATKRGDGSFLKMNTLAMAASYDPDPAAFLGMRLTVTLDTCELIQERWANWMQHDPVIVAQSMGENLRNLKAV